MNSTLTLASALYVLIIGLVALLPQAQLAQPAGRTRLLLGALCGAASLVLAADPQTVALGIGPINPSLVASAAFLWGFGGGAAAVLMALAGLALVPGVDWPLASLLAAASARGCRVHAGAPMLASQIGLMAEFMRGTGIQEARTL